MSMSRILTHHSGETTKSGLSSSSSFRWEHGAGVMGVLARNAVVTVLLLVVYGTQSIVVGGQDLVLKKGEASDGNLVVEAVVNILGSCLTDALDMAVIAGNFRNFATWHSSFPSTLTMYRISLSEDRLFEQHKRLQRIYRLDEVAVSRLRYPAKVFVVSSLLPFALKSILKRLRMSVLWNARATFLLVDEVARCGSVNSALAEAWEYNILHVVYVCVGEMGMVEYYTVNPFSDTSTEVWRMVDVVNATNGHGEYPITVFKLASGLDASNTAICTHLDFSKDLLLPGYPIHMCAQIRTNMFEPLSHHDTPSSPLSDKSIPIPLSHFGGLDASVFKIIWSRLQASPTVTIYDNRGFVDEHNNPRGLIYDLMAYTFDAGANEHYRRSFWRLETYPHDITSMCAVTRRRVQPTSRRIVLAILEPSVLAFIALSSCMSMLFLRCLLRVSAFNATLEVLRTLLGMSTQKEPSMTHGRPLFMYVILLSFNMNIYFGSKLTSDFASKARDNNINTVEDLIDSGYRVMGEAAFNEFLNSDILRPRFVEATLEECIERLHRGGVACLSDCYEANYYAMDKDHVHVSEPLYDTYVAYIVREDWPLLNRVNNVLQRMKETGIITYEDDRSFHDVEMKYDERKEELRDNEDSAFQGKPFPLERFTYNCYMFAVGTVAAMVVFLGELFIRRVKRARVKKMFYI